MSRFSAILLRTKGTSPLNDITARNIITTDADGEGNGIFQRTELLVGRAAMRAFAATRVLLIGTGGVGSWCAEALVRTGIGHISLVDADRVCASNVNRQLMATGKTIGEAKVDVLARRLLEINPGADIVAREARYSAEAADTFDISSYSYVIDAIDSVADKAHLIRHALSFPSVTLYSSMGAARRLDQLRIRTSEFWKVQGDGLARALRARFKKEGDFPPRKFTCVWSDEQPRTDGGTVMHVTAAFGLALAGLVIRDICSRTPSELDAHA